MLFPVCDTSCGRNWEGAEELGTDTEGGYKYFADMIPTHRLLEIEEVGNWAAALCGGLGMATTGSNISITCGQVQL